MRPVVQEFPSRTPGTAPHLTLLSWVSSSDTVAKPEGLVVCVGAVRMRPSSERA